MNWLVLALFTYALVAIEMGMQPVIGLPVSMGGMAPSLLLVLGVYITLMSRPAVSLWIMLLLGGLVDVMSSTVPGGPVLGPNALGFLIGGVAVLQMRGFVFRESVLAMAMMVFVCGVLASLVTIFLLKVRGFSWLTNQPIEGWHSAEQMYRNFMMLIYTTAVSLPLGFCLMKSTPLWGFGPRKSH